MVPLLQEFVDVFTEPTKLPLTHSIEHTIDLIPGDSLSNAPYYHLAPQEAFKIKHQLTNF